MPRPKRKKLKFDEESVNDLLQECYNDSHNIKAKIARLFTKWEQKVKEGGEIQALGETITKLIVAEAKVYDQKLVLLRYLKEVVFAKDNKSENEESSSKISSKERNELIKQVTQGIHKEN
jgi:hypothetical protein